MLPGAGSEEQGLLCDNLFNLSLSLITPGLDFSVEIFCLRVTEISKSENISVFSSDFCDHSHLSRTSNDPFNEDFDCAGCFWLDRT